EGSSTSDSTPQISGTTEPNRDVTVTISNADGDVATGTATADAEGNWAWTPTDELVDGDYTVSADGLANGVGVDDSRSFTVDTAVPADTVILTPADGEVTNDSTPAITGVGEPETTITVTIDDGAPVDVVVDENGNWSHTPESVLGDGEHTVVVDGNGTSDEVTFTVDTTAPDAPAITAPADGSTTNDNTPVVTG